jgi:hypothetical protein
MEKSTQVKIEGLKERAAKRETTRYSENFKEDAVRLVDELRQKNWTQKRINKALQIPWVTLNRWKSDSTAGSGLGAEFRPVKVIDSRPTPTLVSPSGWRIEGLTLNELIKVAGRL